MIVVGLDPGFGHVGLCSCDVRDSKLYEVLAIQHVETVAENERLATESNLSRARQIFDALNLFVETWKPEVLISESQSWPRNASVVAKLGHYWGALAAVSSLHKLPVLHCSPQDIKQTVTGNRSATKEEVQSGLAAITGRVAEMVKELHLTKANSAHPCDAVGAVLAGIKTDQFMMFWRSTES